MKLPKCLYSCQKKEDMTTTKTPKLLLVEDDHGLGYILREYLELHEFAVTWEKEGKSGLEAFQGQPFDLCILDVMLPKMDGFALATAIRKIDKQVPLVFLTSKALKIDKLKGFHLGADDYIVKPVDEEELIARIEAILRRTHGNAGSPEQDSHYQIGDYHFDLNRHTLTFRQEKPQLLTTREAEVLHLLCLHRGRILDRRHALRKIWGESDYFKRRSMDVFISRLRKYLSRDEQVQITNVHGKGYVLKVNG
jgi:DNA-binding response OmpR family regulator